MTKAHPERTVSNHLEAAQLYLRRAMSQLFSAEISVDVAIKAAQRDGKPTDRLEVLKSELHSLTGWAWEKHLEAIQKMATDEARSLE